jgi:hypothetical protein
MVFYTLVGSAPTPEGMVDPGLRQSWRMGGPRRRRQVHRLRPEQRLKDKGIKTVIVTGTSAQGAVVGTSNGSVQRGFRPSYRSTECPREDPYNEQYAAWHLSKGGPAVSPTA